MDEVATMRELQMPSDELAERLRREVEPKQELTGLRMSVMGGSNPTALLSLSDAAGFLKIGSYEEAIRPNSQETIGYVDIAALESWTRVVLGDEELADAIHEENAAGEPFGAVAPRVKKLLQLRVLQVASMIDGEAAQAAS